MFTIRVHRYTAGVTDVYACARYRLHHSVDPVVDLFRQTTEGEPIASVPIGAGDRAYVMNERGDTVDSFRGRATA